MLMNDYINRFVRSSYYQLSEIQSIRHACLQRPRINSWIHSSFHELTTVTAFWLAFRSINSIGCSLFWTCSRYHTTFERPATLAAGCLALWFQAMFDGVQGAAWFRPRLHLGLLCQSLDKPVAKESAFCKSQLSVCAASAKGYQVRRTFVWN